MNPKTILAFLIFAITGIFLYTFVLPFKTEAVDTVLDELTKLDSAYKEASETTALNALRLKKNQLQEQDLVLLQNFIPQKLHAGYLVYNLGQMANQNDLTLKSLQYSILTDKSEKRLLIEYTTEGKYTDFIQWLERVEKSNVLIDVESIRASKNSNKSDVVTFYTKMYAYGIDIN